MAEYIEREAAIAALNKVRDDQRVFKYTTASDFLSARDAIERAIKVLESLPAADVEPVQEWISVKDRLPEIGRSVIAYNAPAKCAAEAMYKGEGMFLQFRWEARLQDQEVTHWMPLPVPPKGE